ncbi:MAG TPA: hypothetical protein VJO12_13735 [Stellaceae bacterium]|nr:hypothetical protein [Stellaceae bacterium]
MVVRAEDDKVLNIDNWSDYIADATVARFESETGIKVHYELSHYGNLDPLLLPKGRGLSRLRLLPPLPSGRGSG